MEGDSRQVPSAELRPAATLAPGNLIASRGQFFDSGHWLVWDHLVRDLRLGVRFLLKDKRFTTLAVLGLGLGVGLSTTIFAIMSAVLFGTPEMKDPDSFVGLFATRNGRVERTGLSYQDYCYYRDRATVFKEMGAESGRSHVVFTPLGQGQGAGRPVDAQGRFVSANFLSIRGLSPYLGRAFSEDDERPGSPPVAILNYVQWKVRFGADPSILGTALIVNGQSISIIGVADPAYQATDAETVLYLPITLQSLIEHESDKLHDPGSLWLTPVARVKPGISLREARAEVDVLASQIHSATPGDQQIRGVAVVPQARDPELDQKAAVFTVVIIAVSTVLLIACSNLANLLLARAVVRRKEIAIRLSVGATRARIICQLLTESLLLALIGGALGLLLSFWLSQLLWVMLGGALEGPPGSALGVDPRVLIYALLLSVASGVSFGLAPALKASKLSLTQAIRSEGMSGDPRSLLGRIWSPRNLLVIVPLGLSLMLLVLGGLSLRFLYAVSAAGPTIDTPHLMGMSFRLSLQGYDEARTFDFQQNLLDRLRTLPGVTSAALCMEMPLFEDMSTTPVATEPGPASSVRSAYNVVSPEFFDTAGVSLVRGRTFTVSDGKTAPPVTVVSEGLARLLWPDQEPLGKRVRPAVGTTSFEVVGVARDIHDQTDLLHRPRPTLYISPEQGSLFASGQARRRSSATPVYELQVLIRTGGDAAGLKSTLVQAARINDPSLYVNVQTLGELIEGGYPMHLISEMLGVLGALALLIAVVGIYAILTYAVSQRTREIGIRMALGAERRKVVALVVRKSLVLTGCGLGLGAAGGFVLGRIFSALVVDIGGIDPITVAAPTLLLGCIAMLASYLPARKAAGIDPVQILRME
jgi:predicted permease